MPAFWAPTGRVPLGSPQTRWTPLTSPPEEGPGDSTAPKGEQKGQATWLTWENSGTIWNGSNGGIKQRIWPYLESSL